MKKLIKFKSNEYLLLKGGEIFPIITQKNSSADILIHNGVQNLFYIESEGAIGYDHEGTVDGVHFTDLGFLRYADFLIKQFENFGLITKE